MHVCNEPMSKCPYFAVCCAHSVWAKQHGGGCDSHRMESKKELDWSGCGNSDVWCLPRPPIRSKSCMACSTLYAIISQQWFYYSVSPALENSTWLNFVTSSPRTFHGLRSEEIFCELFLRDTLIDLLVLETNIYARQQIQSQRERGNQKKHSFSFVWQDARIEMKQFLGLTVCLQKVHCVYRDIYRLW